MVRTLPADVSSRILDAADRLLGRFGYGKTTIDDLAREARIGKGSVYLHFRSKEEVFLSAVGRQIDAVLADLRRIGAREDLGAEERLAGMIQARVLGRFDRFAHYGASLNDLLGALRPALVAQRDLHLLREAELLAGVIAEGQRRGELRAGDPRTIARALITATNSLLPYSLSPSELGDRDALTARTAEVADVLLGGVRGRTRAGRPSEATGPAPSP